MHSPISIQFTLDEDFQRFYARFTVSKRALVTLGTCSGIGLALILETWAHFPDRAEVHPVLWFPLGLFTFFTMLGFLATLVARRNARILQRIWLHLSEDSFRPDDPLVEVEVTGSHVFVSIADPQPQKAAYDKRRRRPRSRSVELTKSNYRDFPSLANMYPLDEVTMSIWGDSWMLLLMDRWSQKFNMGSGGYACNIRITPAVPIGLAQMSEEDRRRLRRLLEESHIPVREVHDEGWVRRALRAARAGLGRGA